MAAAKIATLAIRTLAKPIASQIKQQAQQHQRFRAICISLAQFMHRTEMMMRTNLLRPPTQSSSSSKDGKDGKEGKDGKDGKHDDQSQHHKPRIRPLNEAKAVANGANALAEGFLFALAAALIVGESYRGSRSRAKQRDRTEQGLEELRLITRSLADHIGVDWRDVERQAREVEEASAESEMTKEEEKSGKESKLAGSGSRVAEVGLGDSSKDNIANSPILAKAEQMRREREALQRDRDRLQHAVDVLLRISIKSGWIQGAEALRLQDILDGKDEKAHEKEHESEASSKGRDPTNVNATEKTHDQGARTHDQSPEP